MTNQQSAPEALRLAEEFEKDGWIAGTKQWCAETSAELRRLHTENERLAALVEAQQPAPSAAASVGALLSIAKRLAIATDEGDDQAQGTHYVDKQGVIRCKGSFLSLIEDARAVICSAVPQPSPTPQADSQPAPVVCKTCNGTKYTAFYGERELCTDCGGTGQDLAQRCEVIVAEDGHPNNRHLFKHMCAVVGIELGKDRIADALKKFDAFSAASAPADSVLEDAALSQAARDVLAERQRQVKKEGWTQAHDDVHVDGSLAAAAACYANVSVPGRQDDVPISLWPKSWSPSWWKPKDPRRNLIKAGALILAELERLDRAARKQGGV